jgi:hypothetical protein
MLPFSIEYFAWMNWSRIAVLSREGIRVQSSFTKSVLEEEKQGKEDTERSPWVNFGTTNPSADLSPCINHT